MCVAICQPVFSPVFAVVFAGRDAAFALEHLREMALVAEAGGECDVIDAIIRFLQQPACRIQPLLDYVLARANADGSQEQALKVGDSAKPKHIRIVKFRS